MIGSVCRIFENSASVNHANQLEGVALNASAGLRTVNIKLFKSWRKIKIAVFLTRSAATTVTCALTESYDGVNYVIPQTTDYGLDPNTLTNVAYSKPVSASINLSWMVDVEGVENLNLVFAGASAAGGDLVNVQIIGVIGS